jgi:hypothetical protein
MKRIPTILIICGMVFILSGCTERQRQDWSHWKSDMIGLERTITLYSDSGKPIKKWEGRFKVEINGATARFIHDGRAVIISGTYLIEEKD